ncbi:hypothetical protein ACYSTU_14485 [Pseudomonas glycinis]
MIIVINDLPGLVGDRDKVKAFNNLVMAFGEAKHELWMPSRKISEVIESGVVAGYNLQVLYELKDRSRLTKSILECFEFYVEVDFSTENTLGFVAPNRLVVSYSNFMDSASVQLPLFVAENLSDINFYLLGGKVYLRNKKLLSSHDVRFRSVGGGGNTTVNSFEYSLSQNGMVLCILDSDRTHPSAGLKDTAARFSAYPLGWGVIYWLHILECTEAENLVPWKVADKILSEQAGYNCEAFLGLTDEMRRYADHKNGLMVSDALAVDSLHGIDFWASRLSEGLDPSSWVCQPMGSRFLDRCIDFMREITTHKLAEMVNERDASFMWLSRMVASWGVCPKNSVR